MNAWINLTAVGRILLFGLLTGAVVPVLFAAGVRLHSAAADPGATFRNRALTALSWALFALVLAVVIVGVLYIAKDFIGHHTGVRLFGSRAEPAHSD